ncbi:unnamed protein product [Schistocephalus solidus]|uniref:Reverse transcriptase domain-containing protein n=1 Tax=Schistocephalus solidus TaxID=70667 RepID=A0A183SHN5_SCHSO|nr:unnamed protein product [Schistocephalus solidus]
MLLWPPLTDTQLSSVALRSWAIPSGHTQGNHNHRRDKPGEASCGSQIAKYAVVKLKQTTISPIPKPAPYTPGCLAISNAAIDRLPQVDTNNDLDLLLSLPETTWAVQQISSSKAPGSDAIPPEVYEHRMPRLMAGLIALFQEIWRKGKVPQDFRDATIIYLYKRKGTRQLCDNHGGISLLNIAEKIFACILLNRLNGHLEQGLLPLSQCSFQRHRGTTYMIFATRRLHEKYQ